MYVFICFAPYSSIFRLNDDFQQYDWKKAGSDWRKSMNGELKEIHDRVLTDLSVLTKKITPKITNNALSFC